MNNKTTFSIVIALVLIIAGYLYIYPQIKSGGVSKGALVNQDPYSAAFLIDGQEVLLSDGMAEYELAPGSASKGVVSIVGEPTQADINFDGADDSVVFLKQESGGSGVFYYVGAITGEEPESGSDALFIGDRIEPKEIVVTNGVIVVLYEDRKAGEPMSAAPTIDSMKHLVFRDVKLIDMTARDPRAQIFTGMIHLKGEMRDFAPCGETARWILGDSSAWEDIQKTYSALDTEKTGAPLYGVLTAVPFGSPTSGVGQDYKKSLQVETLGAIIPKAACAE